MAESEDAVFQYLQSKFSSVLQEEEADRNIPSGIISRFRSIESLIISKCRSPPFPIDCLYNLISELQECRLHYTSQGHFGRNRLSNFHFMRGVKKRLDQIKKNLNDIPAGEPTGQIQARSVPMQQTSPAVDTSGIIGFESHTEIIERLLLRNYTDRTNEELEGSITSIGIVGMPGCGKTALAQKVFASPTIQENFSPRIWVSLSGMLLGKEKRVDTRMNILKHILEEIGHDISDSDCADIGVVKLLEKLQRALMGKSFLIVLDDVLHEEWFWHLGHCLPRGHATMGALFSHGLPEGSRGGIIVTGTHENAVRRMVGEKDVIRMELNMSDDLCWRIFSHVVGEMDESWEESKLTPEMKEHIIRKCDGLPLAARTLANVIPPLL